VRHGDAYREVGHEDVALGTIAVVAGGTVGTSRRDTGVSTRDADGDTLQTKLQELVALTVVMSANGRIE